MNHWRRGMKRTGEVPITCQSGCSWVSYGHWLIEWWKRSINIVCKCEAFAGTNDVCLSVSVCACLCLLFLVRNCVTHPERFAFTCFTSPRRSDAAMAASTNFKTKAICSTQALAKICFRQTPLAILVPLEGYKNRSVWRSKNPYGSVLPARSNTRRRRFAEWHIQPRRTREGGLWCLVLGATNHWKHIQRGYVWHSDIEPRNWEPRKHGASVLRCEGRKV